MCSKLGQQRRIFFYFLNYLNSYGLECYDPACVSDHPLFTFAVTELTACIFVYTTKKLKVAINNSQLALEFYAFPLLCACVSNFGRFYHTAVALATIEATHTRTLLLLLLLLILHTYICALRCH